MWGQTKSPDLGKHSELQPPTVIVGGWSSEYFYIRIFPITVLILYIRNIHTRLLNLKHAPKRPSRKFNNVETFLYCWVAPDFISKPFHTVLYSRIYRQIKNFVHY